MSEFLINPVKVKEEMNAMIDMLTHPAFVEAMKNMKATPGKKRLELGKTSLTVEALRAKGVKMPEGMRLTTRYFEPGQTKILEVDPEGISKYVTKLSDILVDNRINGWGGCACGGGLSFCGGAGGST